MLLSRARSDRAGVPARPLTAPPLRRAAGAVAATVLIAGLAAACGSSNTAASSGGAKAKASSRAGQKAAATPDALTVTSPQAAGKSVLVSTVTFEPVGEKSGASPSASAASGYLVLARDLAGHPGATLGYLRVRGGTSHNVTVPVSATLTSGTYWVLLSEGASAPGATAPAQPDVKKKITIS